MEKDISAAWSKRLRLNLNLPNDAMNVFGRTDRREDLKKILVKTNTFPITVNKLIKAQNIVIPFLKKG